MSQQIQSKGLSGSRSTVWQYMNEKGWKLFQRQKKPLLTEKQHRSRLKFAKQYKHLMALEWEDFLFSDECPKYLFQLPNPKHDVVWGLQESQVPPAYQAKGSSKWLNWGGMTGRGLTNLHFIPQGQTVTADYYISQILKRRSNHYSVEGQTLRYRLSESCSV